MMVGKFNRNLYTIGLYRKGSERVNFAILNSRFDPTRPMTSIPLILSILIAYLLFSIIQIYFNFIINLK
jgi:hypothetical protein